MLPRQESVGYSYSEGKSDTPMGTRTFLIGCVAAGSLREGSSPEMTTRLREARPSSRKRRARQRNSHPFGALQHGTSDGSMMPDADTTEPLLDLTDMGASITKLIEGVVLANVRAAQELLRVDSQEAFVELQRRFVREYMAPLVVQQQRGEWPAGRWVELAKKSRTVKRPTIKEGD